MSVAGVLSLVAGTFALFVAGCAAPFVALPRWRKHRMLVPVALSAGFYCLGDVAVTSGLPDELVLWIARAQALFAALHGVAWLFYVEDDVGPSSRKLALWLRWALAALAVLSLIPGVLFGTRINVHTFPELGLVYRDVAPTPLGAGLFLAMLSAALVCAVSYAKAAVRGVPHAFGHFVALLLVSICGTNDAVVSYGGLSMPYLLGLGFLLELILLCLGMARRWAADLRSLSVLSAPGKSNPGRAVSRP